MLTTRGSSTDLFFFFVPLVKRCIDGIKKFFFVKNAVWSFLSQPDISSAHLLYVFYYMTDFIHLSLSTVTGVL